jgi:hypothetical protein
MSYTLLLTSSIKPSQFSDRIIRNNVDQRLHDYLTTFKKWLLLNDANITHIIFADNSGYNLELVKNLAKKYNHFNRIIELIKVKESKVPDGIHYGYSELEIIDECFKLSKHLYQNEKIIKCSGRLFISNISMFLKQNEDFDMMIDSRKSSIIKKQTNYCLSNFFIVKTSFYSENLIGLKSKMIEEKISHFETLYFKYLYEFYTNKKFKIKMRFNTEPILHGYGAHWNKNYQGFKYLLNGKIRNIFRKIAPQLWI